MKPPEEMQKVAVVGGGTMGHGIAQVFASAGYSVYLYDVSEEILSNAVGRIKKSLEKIGLKDEEDIIGRIEPTTDLEKALSNIDVMIEAVPEDIDIKKDVLSNADEIAPSSAIFTSNTSTLPITELASATSRAENVVGMHFSNPPQLMPIVEVIKAEQTSDQVFNNVQKLSKKIGKTPVLVRKDIPGFLLNRINLRYWVEALRQFEEGMKEKEEIDASIRRLGLPMGPFELLDFSGIDVAEKAFNAMKEREVQVHVPSILEEKAESEQYGVKSGSGFYEYPKPGEYSRVDISREKRFDFNPIYLFAPAVNEATWLIDNNIATKEEIDKALQIGMNWPQGLLEFADEYGIDRIVTTLEELRKETGWEEYKPNSCLERMIGDGKTGWKTGEGFYKWKNEKKNFGPVVYEKREFIAQITLNRPEKLNALNKNAWKGLKLALAEAKGDDEVRTTVLTGEGRAFSAGDDIEEMESWETTEDSKSFFNNVVMPTIEELRSHPKPLIAQVDGVAHGGGCEVVMLSDIVISAGSSEFAVPEMKIGAFPPIAMMYGLLRLGGYSGLKKMILTGQSIPAEEAETIGLVDLTVEKPQLEDVVREVARSTTESAPDSIKKVKGMWKEMEDDLLASHFEKVVKTLIEKGVSSEADEGFKAFLEKRPPEWVK